MKEITEVPVNYDHINNLDMRRLFENTDDQPLIYRFFQANGDVSNEADEQGGESYAIEVFNDDSDLIYSFLYNSLFEYEEDCKILKIGKFSERYKVTARITGQSQIRDLKRFELVNFRDGNDYVGESDFNSLSEAQSHLAEVARKYYDREQYFHILQDELRNIKILHMLKIGKIVATIGLIETDKQVEKQ